MRNLGLMKDKGEIIIYKTKNGTTSIDVRMKEETVWLTQEQIAILFGTKRPAITKHLNNIYKSEELDEKNTCSILEHMGNVGKQKYQTKFYNLDAIISVGYRVNSKNATQFRIWANSVLKRYLTEGFAINEKATKKQLNHLNSMLQILSNSLENKDFSKDEAKVLLRIINDYNYGLDTLDRYDNQILEIEKTTEKGKFRVNYDEAKNVIFELKNKFKAGKLFGNEKDASFKSTINTIYQTFDGKELYPSIEDKASMFLYLLVKNHSFSDGNKRIGAFLFLWFLEKNEILYKKNGTKLLENNTLVALTLMIAESKSEEIDTIVKVVINLINKNN